MTDPGAQARMEILVRDAEQSILKPLQTHGWTAKITRTVPEHDYLVVEVQRAGVTHKTALLYTSATSNTIYKQLDAEVACIFFRGDPYHLESYTYGVTAPVASLARFHETLIAWNEEASGGKYAPAQAVQTSLVRRPYQIIQSEAPLEQIWSRLRHFGSVALAAGLIRERAEGSGKAFDANAIANKAVGLAYLIRSAADYFQRIPEQSLSQRILNRYYGTLAFASAEMIASPTGPVELSAIEDMTRQGHGLHSLDGPNATFADLTLMPYGVGFFPHWMKFLGKDTNAYPSKKKPKVTADINAALAPLVCTMEQLFSRVPELLDLYVDVFTSAPAWIRPTYDGDANQSAGLLGHERPRKTYAQFVDVSGRFSLKDVGSIPGPISQIKAVESKEPGVHFRVLVDHPEHETWWDALAIHRSPFVDHALILPFFGSITEFRVLAFVLLYGLSILVRYRPSVWRRTQEGDWDQYKVLTEALLDIIERVLPEEFLEQVTGLPVHARQPGSLF